MWANFDDVESGVGYLLKDVESMGSQEQIANRADSREFPRMTNSSNSRRS